MKSMLTRSAFALALMMTPLLVWAQSIDTDQSYAVTRAGERVSVMLVPGGGGTPFDQALRLVGGTLDATVDVYLLDDFGEPVVGYPREDIWLHVNGVHWCDYGNLADAPTDDDGHTTFTFAPSGGEHSGIDRELEIRVSDGGRLRGAPRMEISFNSPDVDGDGEVEASDVQRIQNEIEDPYDYRFDLNFDGAVTETDVNIAALYQGDECAPDTRVDIDAEPDSLNAGWELSGPGVLETGAGDRSLFGLPVGNYTLTWQDLPCYDEPDPNPATGFLSDNGSLNFSGWYDMAGRAEITLYPDSLQAAWTFEGPPGFTTIHGRGDTLITCLDEGEYTVTWLDVPCHVTPSPAQQSHYISSSSTYGFHGNYQPYGLLIVEVWPDTLMADWILEGPPSFGTMYGQGRDTLDCLEPGTYTITWQDMPCFTTPDPDQETETVHYNSTSHMHGYYMQNGALQIDVEPDLADANWQLEGPPPFTTVIGHGDSLITCLEEGYYTLTWLPTPGWYTYCQSPRDLWVNNGSTNTENCTFYRNAALEVDPLPAGGLQPWRVQGPGGYDHTGTGHEMLVDLEAGGYTITWEDEADAYPSCLYDPEYQNWVDIAEGETGHLTCLYLEYASLQIDIVPDLEDVYWHLSGPDLYESGSTDRLLTELHAGDYELDVNESLACWSLEGPWERAFTLVGGEAGLQEIILLEHGTVLVDPEPDELAVASVLEAPDGGTFHPSGNAQFDCFPPGEYVLTWDDPQHIIPPVPNPVTGTLEPGGTLHFVGVCTAAGDISIAPQPTAHADGFGWRLTGPGGLDETGTGPSDLFDAAIGDYALEWLPSPFWIEPAAVQLTLGWTETIVFDDAYLPGPRLLAVADEPDDEGRRVRLSWDRCFYDDAAEGPEITGYGVYRRQGIHKAGAVPAARPKLAGWDFVTTLPAGAGDLYQVVVPTLGDSTDVGAEPSVFFVSAMTSEPWVYFDSPPDSGWSLDNLAPEPPGSLDVDFLAEGNRLAWEPSAAPDVAAYRVYRSLREASGSCDQANRTLAHTTSSTGWTDGPGHWNACYLVAAVDSAGNEGEATVWSQATVSGVELTPSRFALHAAAPNPFNPSTTIAYELAEDSPARMIVYDLTGRVVRVLVDAPSQPRGRYEAEWNGCDDRGRRCAAGVYLCRLVAGPNTAVVRMALLK